MQDLKQPFIIKAFDVGPMQNLVYVISDKETNFAAIVDPAWDLKEVYLYIDKNNLELKNILLTHSHNDHVNAIDQILLKFDLSIHLNNKEKIFWNKSYDNFKINYGGDIINLGSTEIKSIYTPGHTPGSTCYQIGNNLIAGDTLFVFGCGRCDLHGGNPEEMFMTLKNLKSSLDEKTIILPGHDYSVKRSSTMNEQKLGNPFFHFDSLDKFVEYRMSLHDKIRNTPYDFIKKNGSH
tara:strand:+ start:335 stop:1042 length:708 start_codon:yes stop_codon:yes gene_type:complete